METDKMLLKKNIARLSLVLISALVAFLGYRLLMGPSLSVEVMVSDLQTSEATAELCGPPVDCVAGYKTQYGNYLEFKSDGGAERWALIIGDEGRRLENIVLDMRGYDLDFEERLRGINILYSSVDWE